jgi:hypothetical protein
MRDTAYIAVFPGAGEYVTVTIAAEYERAAADRIKIPAKAAGISLNPE